MDDGYCLLTSNRIASLRSQLQAEAGGGSMHIGMLDKEDRNKKNHDACISYEEIKYNLYIVVWSGCHQKKNKKIHPFHSTKPL